MAGASLSVSAFIDAAPRDVYAVLADYCNGHRQILPRPPFTSLVVERGGIGEGTHILVEARVLGFRGSYRSVVTEPDPGRVLVETNDNGFTTTFIVEPRDEGRRACVTISTEMVNASPWKRRLIAFLLRPVFTKELAQLAVVLRDGDGKDSPAAQAAFSG